MEATDLQNVNGLAYSTVIEGPKKIETSASLELLKIKLYKSDMLIKDLNDTKKECELLREKLGKKESDAKEILQLKIENKELKEEVKELRSKFSDLAAKNEGDQQNIRQLTCKIVKQEEEEKNLQQQLKIMKKTRFEKKIPKRNQGTNTDAVQIVDLDVRLSEETKLLKNRLTGTEVNEILQIDEEKSSMFCTKCIVALDNVIGSENELPQALISPIFSSDSEFKPKETHKYTEPVLMSPTTDRIVVEPEHLTDPSEETNLDSEKMTSLEKRLKNLERKIKKQKNSEDRNRCCHSNSNSYFPNPVNQEVMFEIWKQLQDKCKPSQKRNYKKSLKRCKDKRKAIHKKKEKRKTCQNWSVESSTEFPNFTEPSIPQEETSTFEPENLVKTIPSSSKKINFSTANNLEAQIEENSFEKARAEFSVTSIEKNLSILPVPLPNDSISDFEEWRDLIQISEPTTLIAEKFNHHEDSNASKENEDFEMLEVSREKLTTSSPNMESLTNQEEKTVSSQSSTLSKVILEREETVSILGEIKDDQRTIISNISASSPNVETPIMPENNTASKNSFILPKEILQSEESVLISEKSKDDHQMKTSKENHTSQLPEVSHDTISTSSHSIVEIPKNLRIQTDPTKEVLEESPTLEESEKIVENESRSKMRTRLTSHCSGDSLGLEPARKSLDFQNLNSQQTRDQNLVSLGNLEKEKEKDTDTPEENLEKDESSITNQVQVPESLSSFENFEELEHTEEISQEGSSSSEVMKYGLLDDLILSDEEEPLKERKIDSSIQSSDNASGLFITNSKTDNSSKNFMQGNRSSKCLLTVISPIKMQKRKRAAEILKSTKTGDRKTGDRKTLLRKIRTLKRSSNKIIPSSTIKKTEEKCNIRVETPKPAIEKVNSVESTDSNSFMPCKKRRIAHTSKAESEFGSLSYLENYPIEVPIRKSLRSASKSPAKPKNNELKPPEKKLIQLEEKEEQSPVVRKKGRPRKVQLPEANLPKDNLEEESRNVESSSLGNLPEKADLPMHDNLNTETKDQTLMKNVLINEDEILLNRLEVRNKHWEKANEILVRNKVMEQNNEEFCRELRSRQIEKREKECLEKFQAAKRQPSVLNPDNKLLKTHYIIKLLNEKFDRKNHVPFVPISKFIQTKTEKKVQQLLNELMNSEIWSSELHFKITEEISKVCQEATAAKCIVKFLEELFLKSDERLDTSNTPPAPPMTKSQQKIVTLISSLEKSMPNIFNLVSSGITHTIFRLNEVKENVVIAGFARVYTSLARLKKDRQKARLFCCDALYCLRMNAITVIYAVLSCWPEVLPICNRNPEILPKCMVHIILTADSPGVKIQYLASLKSLISAYHQYPKSEYISENLASEFLTALKNKHEYSTDMAIILLAKKQGPRWTEINIIRELRTMILENTHPSAYHAFNLIGNLMRTFPAEEEDQYINKTVQELCDLMNLHQDMEDHLEGVVSALLSLSKFLKYFGKIAKSVLLWQPSIILHADLRDKLDTFFAHKSPGWWFTFIKNDYTMPFVASNENNKRNNNHQLNKVQDQKRKKRTKKKKAGASPKVPSNS